MLHGAIPIFRICRGVRPATTPLSRDLHLVRLAPARISQTRIGTLGSAPAAARVLVGVAPFTGPPARPSFWLHLPVPPPRPRRKAPLRFHVLESRRRCPVGHDTDPLRAPGNRRPRVVPQARPSRRRTFVFVWGSQHGRRSAGAVWATCGFAAAGGECVTCGGMCYTRPIRMYVRSPCDRRGPGCCASSPRRRWPHLATVALDLICFATDMNEYRVPSDVLHSPTLAVHPSGFHALPTTPIRSAPHFIFGNRVGVNLGV
ncbi:hypothetical protein B0H14DRAFT_3713833 [Mycena olivaceomarginata]|nr:hypothetical protein B0H14DRAFT_3713833 [Mycena olivaceomarginata]